MTGEEMWKAYCQKNNVAEDTPHEAWKFCGGGPLADELANLVLAGVKTATAGLKFEYDLEKVPLPEVGMLDVILFDNDEAACIIQSTKVSVVPFDEVSAEHAYKEGEGDRSLEFWRTVHREAFTPCFEAVGKPFDEHGDMVLLEFKMVYPRNN